MFGADASIPRRERHYRALYQHWLADGRPIATPHDHLLLHDLRIEVSERTAGGDAVDLLLFRPAGSRVHATAHGSQLPARRAAGCFSSPRTRHGSSCPMASSPRKAALILPDPGWTSCGRLTRVLS